MAVEAEAFRFAKRDEVRGLELELRGSVKGEDVVDLELRSTSASGASRVNLEVLGANARPRG